jgi:gamma-glutamylcyclotransferase (GGCT)/AIG2-like uncharacterized protein YtfP
MCQSVFVYGTLKPGLRYYRVAQEAGLFTQHQAWIDGFELYHLSPENYPALRPGIGRVYGWRYQYADIEAALVSLDRLEGLHLNPPEYTRIQTACQPGGQLAWVYIYFDPTRLERPGASRISSGDWQPEKAILDAVPKGLFTK